MAGGGYWWRNANATANLSTTKITPSVFQIDPTQAMHALTYSWLAGTESYLSPTKDLKGFASLSQGQKTAVKSALDYLSTLVNVTFTEANSPASANINFGTNDQGTTSAGYATYPNGNVGNPSKLMLANNDTSGTLNSAANLGTKGGYGWETLIHEMGHVMGLKHPGNYNAGGGGTSGPYLPGSFDNRRMSIMSYKNPAASNQITVTGTQSTGRYSYVMSAVNPTTYGVFDIAAMQYLYGANTSTTTSDLNVTDEFFLNSDGSQRQADYRTLWAPNGVKLDASSTTRSNIFDLREGAYSSIAIKTPADLKASIKDSLKSQSFDETTAANISNTIFKKVGSKLYNGKNNLGLAYGSQYKEIIGGSGNDSFYAGSYSTNVDGAGGTNDTLYLAGKANNWIIDQAAGTATNKLNNAVITYTNIEKIAYYSATSSVIHA